MASLVPSTKQTVSPTDFFHREFDRLFDNFGLAAFRAGEWAGAGRVTPEIDYAETDKEIIVTAELPGVDAKDVDVSLQNSELTIRGEKRSQRDEKKENYRFTERTYGAFERMITVPEGIDPAKVKADFDKGVLKVTLPKPAEMHAKRHKIEVKAPAASA
jgi:HSP20 family protein